MRLLYPCHPFEKSQPDENFQEEYLAVTALGIPCSLFTDEAFERGVFKPRPAFESGETILYRGWMLTLDNYARLYDSIQSHGAKMLVSPEAYSLCHHLPNWLTLCSKLTPKTLILEENSDFETVFTLVGWDACFVKDYVKSLTTPRGSVARNAAEVRDILAQIKDYRGQIEGGVCIRQFENLAPDAEERYFVLNGVPHARDNVLPDIVHEIVGRINSPFYSIDIAINIKGEPRLIELGDGQVSDRKKWSADVFAKMLDSFSKSH